MTNWAHNHATNWPYFNWIQLVYIFSLIKLTWKVGMISVEDLGGMVSEVWPFLYYALIIKLMIRPKNFICVFQVSWPYLDFCPDPKHFIVNCEQNVVKFGEKLGKMYWKMQFLYKIFWQNKMLCRPTIPSFFRAETWNTHIFFLFALMSGLAKIFITCSY